MVQWLEPKDAGSTPATAAVFQMKAKKQNARLSISKDPKLAEKKSSALQYGVPHSLAAALAHNPPKNS